MSASPVEPPDNNANRKEPDKPEPNKPEPETPEPPDPFTRADRRAEKDARNFARDLRQQGAKGAAFWAGKKFAEDIYNWLTGNN